MTKYTYLLIDLLSVLIPLAFSFHHKIQLYKYWAALIPAIFITALFYLLWDSWFVYLGVWGFNQHYITGIHIGNLPLEEVLFFICIPYACIFTYKCISGLIPSTYLQGSIAYINYIFAAILAILAIIFHNKPYTLSAFALLAVMILIGAIKKLAWLPKFYLVYIILLIPFLVVNGLLTGTGLARAVVWYSANGIIGLRILTIPIEDIFYGMGLILSNIWIYQSVRHYKLPD